jgi:hypothetical protein
MLGPGPFHPLPRPSADILFRRLQGEIDRAVYDFFLFQPGTRAKMQ